MSSHDILPEIKIIAKLCAVCLIQSSYVISSCSTVRRIFVAVSQCQVVGEIVVSQVGQCDSVFIHGEGFAADKMAGGHCVPVSALQTGGNVPGVIDCLREGMFLMCEGYSKVL